MKKKPVRLSLNKHTVSKLDNLRVIKGGDIPPTAVCHQLLTIDRPLSYTCATFDYTNTSPVSEPISLLPIIMIPIA